MNRKPVVTVIALLLAFGFAFTCARPTWILADESEGGRGVMQIQSTAFGEGDTIPKKHTCEGEDISPQLSWSGVPGEAKSLVMICDDPDAPAGTWVHWVVYDIPATRTELPKGIPAVTHPEIGGVHGSNDFRRPGYGGPCPPGGTHRYYFRLFALDATLDLEPGATKRQLQQAMSGHVLAQGELMGTCTR